MSAAFSCKFLVFTLVTCWFIGLFCEGVVQSPSTLVHFSTLSSTLIACACILSCMQILATALLLVGVMALTDIRHSNGKNSHLVPFYAGGLVAALCMAFGLNCGCPLNPARDLAPRIFTSIAGWGIKPFR